MDGTMQELVTQSHDLVLVPNQHDYAFAIFPMAKAYEGFLKKLFFTLKFISKQQFYGDRFRIGRSLNPNLPKRYQSDWVFGKLQEFYKGDSLPLRLWEMWRRGRNQVFHYMPDHMQEISQKEALNILGLFSEVMECAILAEP